MKISIFDLSTGISWTDPSTIWFAPKAGVNKDLIDYLNEADETDIVKLKNFRVILETGNDNFIEDYINLALDGFLFFENNIYYGMIAGVTDKGMQVLYNFTEHKILLMHPNIGSMYEVNLDALIQLIEQKVAIMNTLRM